MSEEANINLEVNLDDAQDFVTVPAEVYELQVVSAEPATAKSSGRAMIKLRLSLMEQPEEGVASDIYTNLMLPTPDQEKPKYVATVNRIKQFIQAFNLDLSGKIDAEAICEAAEGATGYALLDVEEGYDGTPRNTVKRYVVAP